MRDLIFTKMHGCANDYIVINGIEEQLENPSEFAEMICKRHYSVGADGLIIIQKSLIADWKMKMYNADGSLGKMCGNGIRCVGKYLYKKGLLEKKLDYKPKISIETDSGIKDIYLNCENNKLESVTVDMGIPEFVARRIPVSTNLNTVINEHIYIDDYSYNITCVSMGNPHAVLFCDDISRIIDDNNEDIYDAKSEIIDIKSIGAYLENHKLFPERVNVECVKLINKNQLNVVVWERGSGETMSCGSGACACVAAGYVTGRCGSEVEVNMKGGSLLISYDTETKHIYLTGEAEIVFEGRLKLH